jgi:putative oxidoreductase
MKYLYLVLRILLGALFVFSGINGLHPLSHMEPPPASSLPGQFMAVMVPTGWMHIVSALELLGGVLVLIGGTAPLGLICLGPIILNAILFHALLAGGKGIAPSLVSALFEIVLIYAYRANFAGIFTAKATPVA